MHLEATPQRFIHSQSPPDKDGFKSHALLSSLLQSTGVNQATLQSDGLTFLRDQFSSVLAQLISNSQAQRNNLAEHYLTLSPRERRHYAERLSQPPGISRGDFSALESDVTERCQGALNTESYRVQRSLLAQTDSHIELLKNLRNTSPELIRYACRSREQAAVLAYQQLKTEPLVRIGLDILPVISPCHGIEGRALLIAQELKYKIPHCELLVRGCSDRAFEGEWRGIIAPPTASEHAALVMSEPDLRIGIYPSLNHRPPLSQLFAAFTPLSRSFNVTYPSSLHVQSVVSNDLADPFCTLPLNSALAQAQAEKQKLNATTLMEGRQDWLRRNLMPAAHRSLERLGQDEGWQPQRAIWGIAYVQDKARLVREARALNEMMKKGSDLLPFIEEGAQIVIHARLGALSPDDHFYAAVFHSGIRVVSRQGDLLKYSSHQQEDSSNPQVTIVLHGEIAHHEFTECLAQHTGCLRRDSVNNEWINFPAWVTGSASWLEAISAGLPFRHDDNDALQSKEPQIIALIAKHTALNEVTSSSWDEIYERAQSQAPQYLLGVERGMQRYLDLERWTCEAKLQSQAFFKMNSVDDLAIALTCSYSRRNS